MKKAFKKQMICLLVIASLFSCVGCGITHTAPDKKAVKEENCSLRNSQTTEQNAEEVHLADYVVNTTDYVDVIRYAAEGAEQVVFSSGVIGEDTNAVETWTWKYDNGVLTVSGTGTYGNQDSPEDYPWAQYKENTKKIVIEDGIESLPHYAFDGFTNAVEITLPMSVTYLGFHCLANCGFTELNLPGNLGFIDNDVAFGCQKLTKIVFSLPNNQGVATVHGTTMLAGLPNLKEIVVPEGHPNFYAEDNVLYHESKTVLLRYPAGKTEESFTIPNTVVDICDGAFSGCNNLEKVELSNSVVRIGSRAFMDCRNLKEMNLPENMEIVEREAFSNCTGLMNVDFGNNCKLQKIDYETFYGCSSLESIVIPDSVSEIGTGAFERCLNLKNVTFGENSQLTVIEHRAFAHCDSLTSLAIPDSVTTIGLGALRDNGLQSVVFGPDSQLTVIDEQVFAGCQSLHSITLPNSITKISSWAFGGCCTLKTLVIPDGVESIDAEAFRNCEKLVSITVPVTVTEIGENAFMNCDGRLHIFYTGAEEQWKSATKGVNSTDPGTTVVYNYKEGDARHVWSEPTQILRPQCTEEGTESYTCIVCGEIRTETVAPTGHRWPVVDYVPKICLDCGISAEDAATHQWVAASCRAPKTCTVCGKTEGKPLEHSWNSGVVKEDTAVVYTCTACGAEKVEGTPAEPTAPSVTEPPVLQEPSEPTGFPTEPSASQKPSEPTDSATKFTDPTTPSEATKPITDNRIDANDNASDRQTGTRIGWLAGVCCLGALGAIGFVSIRKRKNTGKRFVKRRDENGEHN